MHYRSSKVIYAKLLLISAMTMVANGALAGPREQAKRMHDRLVGVPPINAVVDSMADKITNGDTIGAAMEAMQNPAFYNTTLREFATPWTNRDPSLKLLRLLIPLETT